MIKIRVDGDLDIIKKLNEIPIKIKRNVIRKVSIDETKEILSLVNTDAPEKTGALKRSHGKKIKSYTKAGQSGEIVTLVGVREDYIDIQSGKKPIYYATRIHQKNPWLQRVFGKWANSALSRVEEKIKQQL